MPKIKIQDKAIGLRIPTEMYEKLLDLSLKKSKEKRKNIGVSDVIRTIIEKELKWGKNH